MKVLLKNICLTFKVENLQHLIYTHIYEMLQVIQEYRG